MIDVWMITIAFWVIVACLALGAVAWAASACIALRDSWRDARAVIEQTQAELSDKAVSRLGAILFCPVCHPGGHGRCTCVAYCGDRQCTYGYTAQLSAEESAWLRGLGITEGMDR